MCYEVNRESLTWEEARQSCLYKGGEIASVTDPIIQDFLMRLTPNIAWIGGYKNDEDTWVWTDNSTWSYDNWYDQNSLFSEAKVGN